MKPAAVIFLFLVTLFIAALVFGRAPCDTFDVLGGRMDRYFYCLMNK
jgi:hypothetical protein